LAAAPFTALIAPSSCMRAGKPAAPLTRMLAEGIGVALGTDNVTANNSYDLFKEMQILGKLSSYREQTPNPVSAKTIVEMATVWAARALGVNAGQLAPGRAADMIALNLDEIGWGPSAQDVYTALVYAISGMHVTDSMVGGRWLMRDRALLTVDYPQVCREMEAAWQELKSRRQHV
jgi:5-methylthioadenosine/S-adenosylhomocysteine deaminase